MRGRPEEINQTLTTLIDTVVGQLSTQGWSRRLLGGDGTDATLTRPAQNGVLAVIEIARRSFRWPDNWPVEMRTSLGIGYELALNLMPLLTMEPRATLIEDPEHGRTTNFAVTLSGPDGVGHVAEQIVNFVNEYAATIARKFPDAATIDEHLARQLDEAQTWSAADSGDEDEEDDEGAADFDTQLRLVLLAAMGEHHHARALLATYPTGRVDGAIERDDRRFIRQLTRWLDSGGPVAPPVEDTVAQLLRPAEPRPPSWSDARTRSAAKKDALDAVRAEAEGKTLNQLKAAIQAEHSARGLEIAPSVVNFTAEMLQLEQQPFGRARTALKALRMLKSSGGGMIRLIKQASEADPDWLQPPDRASYPVIADRDRYTSVELDPAAHDWIEHVRADAPRRMGLWIWVDVWLSRQAAGSPVQAHIGQRLVGTLSPSDCREFDDVFRAAALFDEDLYARGRLTDTDQMEAVVLEIPLPHHPEPSPNGT